jgi:hypothetical protein
MYLDQNLQYSGQTKMTSISSLGQTADTADSRPSDASSEVEAFRIWLIIKKHPL